MDELNAKILKKFSWLFGLIAALLFMEFWALVILADERQFGLIVIGCVSLLLRWMVKKEVKRHEG